MKNNYLVRLRRPRASSPLEWVVDNAADKNEAIQIAENSTGFTAISCVPLMGR